MNVRRLLHFPRSAHQYAQYRDKACTLTKPLYRFAHNKSNASWKRRQLNDVYVRMRDEQQYRSRAAFKLIEINDKVHLLPNAMRGKGVRNAKSRRGCSTVVELGSAPGSWSQVILEHLGSGARSRTASGKRRNMLVSVDLQNVQTFDKDVIDDTLYHHITGDFTEEHTVARVMELVGDRQVDAVLSDMAPNTSGIADHDHDRIMDLCDSVLEFSKNMLRPGGSMLVKYFVGAEEIPFRTLLKSHFSEVRTLKPGSSREESREAFMFARGFQPTSRKGGSKRDGNDDSRALAEDKFMDDFGFS